LRFHAVLRREFFWGNFNLDVFDGLFGVPRRYVEEGGPMVFPPSVGGTFNVILGNFRCRCAAL
jgi:hypothetical protein